MMNYNSMINQQQVPVITQPPQQTYPYTIPAVPVPMQQNSLGHSTSLLPAPQDPVMPQQQVTQNVLPLEKPNFHANWFPQSDESSDSTKTLPSNATESALQKLLGSNLCLETLAAIEPFLQLLKQVKTEPEQAMTLIVLRATATCENKKLARACTLAFEKSGGLTLMKQWLEHAVEWCYSDLLCLVLDVLKVLPVQLASITSAKINEPIVKLRKSNESDAKVKQSATELLKLWRTKFTAKAKQDNADEQEKPKVQGKESPKTEESESAKAMSKAKLSNSKSFKRRPIKVLKRLPHGGGLSVSRSSDLIGNLMQRNSMKDNGSSTSVVGENGNVKVSEIGSDSNNSSKRNVGDKVNSFISSSMTAKNEDIPPQGQNDKTEANRSSEKSPLPDMVLPTIQSFNDASNIVSKKIRWADEEGKELEKIKLIESWRDLVEHTEVEMQSSTFGSSFRDAKLREHASERNTISQHKDVVAAPFVPPELAYEWVTPAILKIPEALEAIIKLNTHGVQTDETHIQSARTRREMEYLVLDGEVPPVSPKEWTPSPQELQQQNNVRPVVIPLSDVNEVTPVENSNIQNIPVINSSVQSAPTPIIPIPSNEVESEEERMLREALGPLKKETIALLLEYEESLPEVYDEAQRNGNRIADARVVAITNRYRNQRLMSQKKQKMLSNPPSNFNSHRNNTAYGGNVGYHPVQSQTFPHLNTPGTAAIGSKRKPLPNFGNDGNNGMKRPKYATFGQPPPYNVSAAANRTGTPYMQPPNPMHGNMGNPQAYNNAMHVRKGGRGAPPQFPQHPYMQGGR